MANTVDLKNLDEHLDTEEDFERKVKELSELVRASKSLLFFTGAGISTSSGIPDFRSKDGVWTRQAQNLAPPKSVKMQDARPTPCHLGIVALMNEPGREGYCVSQNIDGLHRRSGLRADQIAELHGNTFEEVCWQCGDRHLRAFEVHGGLRKPGSCGECLKHVPHFCHCTPRLCATCGVHLKDSIIHFKENLPAKAIAAAFDFSKKADLCIVLGSSCTVSPACLIPKEVQKHGGKLVVVNLQRTPLDPLCSLRIFSKTDILMIRLFEALGAPLPDEAVHAPGPAAADEDLPSFLTRPVREEAQEISDDQDQGGYVQPSTDCPHVGAVSRDPLTLERALEAFRSGCQGCHTPKEGWVCLTCLRTHCGRYQAKHGIEHAHQEAHPIAISLSDLNTWCYQCEEYVLSDVIQPFHDTFYCVKFELSTDK